MSNLVKRLRAGPYDRFDPRKNQELEAADYIEALEAALRMLIDNVKTGSYESTGQAIAAIEAWLPPEQDK